MARKKSSKKVLSAMRKVERKAVLLEFSGKDAKEGYTKEKARRDLLWLKQKAMLEIDQKGVNAGNFTTFLMSVKGLIELDNLLGEFDDNETLITGFTFERLDDDNS
ncbi:hypothetical protein RyT2_11510 [Pseudolactococcus yaeyamensis]